MFFNVIKKYNFSFFILSFIAFFYFQFCYKYHFFIQEQNQIFLFSRQYLSEYFLQNSWLTCLLGDFLTQFFYYLFVGPIVTSTIIFLTTAEIFKSCKKILENRFAFIISIVLEIVLIFTVFNYNFKLDYLLSVYFGFLLFNIYTFLSKSENLFFAIISVIIIYHIAGFAQIFFAVLYSSKLLKDRRLKEFIIIPVIAFIIPLFGQRIFQTTYKNNLSYPNFYFAKFPDRYMEFSYAIATEYYFNHFDKVEQLALQQDTMSAQSGIYYNMIQAQKGILPDKIKNQAIPELGTLIHIDENSPFEAICLMNDFYYLIGDMAMAERAAIMAQVFSPRNRNIKMIKRLCEISLVTNDTAIAMKYVGILEKTLLYKSWAKKHNPYSLDKKVEKEISEKRKFCNKSNAIRINDNCREILIQLLESNPDNFIALDYLLCTDLILRQKQTFRADYYKFCIQTNRKRLNNLYIEALGK